MKITILSVMTALTAAVIFPFNSYATDGDFVFTYDYKDAQHDIFGIQRCVQIDAAMIEGGMSDPLWFQANEYFDSNFEGPYWDLFCGKSFRVNGLIYDDVIVNFPSTKGIDGSLPSVIFGETEYSHNSVLDLKDAVCKYPHIKNYGESIIKDPDKLRIVALLIDGKTGEVCNSATSDYSGNAEVYGATEEVEAIPTDIYKSEIVSTEYYTINGIRLNCLPDNGPVIIVRHMADGKIRTEKKIK